MGDIQKEEFAFELYNQLQDEFGLVDTDGKLALQILEASGKALDKIINSLKAELLRNMKCQIA